MKYNLKVIKDSSWNILDYISTLLIFLIIVKLLITNLGSEGYGVYMLFSSLIGTFGLVDIGVGVAVGKYLSEYMHAQEYDKCNEVITFALKFYCLFGLIIFFLLFIFNRQVIEFVITDDRFLDVSYVLLRIVSVVFILNLLNSVATNILTALEKWKAISLINIIFKFIGFLGIVMSISIGKNTAHSLELIFYSIIIVSIIKLFVSFIVARIRYKFLALDKPSKAIRDKMYSFLKYSSIQFFLSIFVGHLDKIIISRYFGLDSLGTYSFVVSVFSYIYGLLVNIFKISFPKLAKLHGSKDFDALYIEFKKLIGLALIISILIAVSSIVLWKPMISIYMNVDFADETHMLFSFFALLLVVRSPEVIFSFMFNAMAKPSVLVKNLTISAPLVVCMYIIIIPILGVEGLILSQIIGFLVVYIYNFWVIKRSKNNMYG